MSAKRILLVDDEPSVLESLLMILSRDGHDLQTASEGMEALEKMENDHFDLVLTDFRLPGMQGDQLAQEIKRRNPSQRIIMLTGFPPAIPPVGCDRVLAKPFSLVELRKAIAES